ncbi:heavy metal translocating P-type ATPase [Enterococcus sp. C50]|uniref:heavy metal translocating P-type ATPase n=1 Tax=Enterococcus sp. C50 TaxID=3231311 RepID=UPI00349FED84
MTHLKKFLLTVLIGGIALISEFIFHQSQLAFFLIAVTGGILAFLMFLEMIKTLRSGKYGVDILAITAIVATLIVKEYWASLMILIMLTGGDSLEDYANQKASKELQALLDNTPQTAHKWIDGNWQELPVEQIEVNDKLVVKPGETVPVDGRVIKGSSEIDESSLTGESQPITKNIGDMLLSGSINGDRSLEMRVEKRAADSQYQLILNLVQESKEKPAKFVRMADRYAVPFTLVAYFIGGIAWWLSGDPHRFVEVLVVASPCPLILAAPVALVAGMSRSSKNGIVVKNGTTLEKLAVTKTIAFDKTGTITKGQLEVTAVQPAGKLSKEELLMYAASAEQESSHILARSLVSYAKNQKLLPTSELKEIVGQGIEARIDNHFLQVGRAKWLGVPEIASEETIIYVAFDREFVGTIHFADVIRPEATNAIKQLKDFHLKQVMMLTGDTQTVAQTIAKKVGITTVHAQCLPQDKWQILADVPEKQRPVTMVGDGVNDAPALSAADVGIAMGAHGATAASESADVVILKDDLTRVPEAVLIAKETMRIARQSVLIGIFICIALMLIASFGIIPALLGAMLQEVVDTVSILSALRAKK